MNQILIIETDGDIVTAVHHVDNERRVKRISGGSEDFLVASCLLIDELYKLCAPQYYNGSTVCITSNNKEFTVGKIYDFKDGQTVCNNGATVPTGHRIKHLSEVNTKGLKFLELI